MLRPEDLVGLDIDNPDASQEYQEHGAGTGSRETDVRDVTASNSSIRPFIVAREQDTDNSLISHQATSVETLDSSSKADDSFEDYESSGYSDKGNGSTRDIEVGEDAKIVKAQNVPAAPVLLKHNSPSSSSSSARPMRTRSSSTGDMGEMERPPPPPALATTGVPVPLSLEHNISLKVKGSNGMKGPPRYQSATHGHHAIISGHHALASKPPLSLSQVLQLLARASLLCMPLFVPPNISLLSQPLYFSSSISTFKEF